MTPRVFASVFALTVICAASLAHDSKPALAQEPVTSDSTALGDPILSEATLILTESEKARYLISDVLEVAALLPSGTTLSVPKEAPPQNYDYRDSDGTVKRSSNGFYRLKIVRVDPAHEKEFPAERIAALNATSGGLFMASSAINSAIGEPIIQPLKPATQPGADYLKNYSQEGQPKFSFTKKFEARFGDRLNLVIPASSLTQSEQKKWAAVLAELARAANRTVPTDGSLLFIDQKEAEEASLLFEKDGTVQTHGAWTIAVKATAPRHGFPNVPCAEFVSEQIREAYQRAGYNVAEDFNDQRGNRLIWDQTAAVVNLTTALFKAGWIPWEAAKFKIPTGAPVMHEIAKTPGHAYVSAGMDGRFIMDNGSPRGRDLYVTSDKIINLMYRSGVFFLPPGIIPEPWPEPWSASNP